MITHTDKYLQDELNKVFATQPRAMQFFNAFTEYCHLIDDIIDEDDYQNSTRVLEAHKFGLEIYNSDFYRANAQKLYPIVAMIHEMYADSVVLEKSNSPWRQEMGAHLAICGVNMLIFLLTQFCTDQTKLRELSIKIREHSWKKHHTVKDEA